MFEDLGAQDISAEQAYLSGVRRSEIYVGMWGPRYGVRMPDGYSATHAEFLEAERNGLRLCLYVHDEQSGAMDGAQRDLIASARNLYTTSPWSYPADLERRVRRRLEELAAEDLARGSALAELRFAQPRLFLMVTRSPLAPTSLAMPFTPSWFACATTAAEFCSSVHLMLRTQCSLPSFLPGQCRRWGIMRV
ncbi:DUF4062 domain-containing protein [Mycobacterium sp. BMJ-28]